MSQITFTTNGQTVMTTTRSYDNLNRLTGIASVPAAAAPVSFAYGYNAANQRIRRTESDASYWSYAYDQLGQVTSGRKYGSDGTPVAGQQFEYAFDDIGNRRSATRDGRAASYTANQLSQYTQRTVPGFVNILGEATNTATVTVWTEDGLFPTTRHGDYWRAEVAVSNAVPLWLALTNLAVLNQGTNADLIATNRGHLLVPPTPETFTYDADGNLTSDSLWTNTWNAENRRTLMESRSGVPAAARVRVQWTHLPDGRWIERIVSTNTGSGYVAVQTNRYVWDGNVLLAVLNHTNGLELSFLRGLDLSGTEQGAGGVGGLLFVGDFTSAIGYHAVAYDGNGNVMALVNAADGTESARYEYGPFGEPLRVTGPMGRVNPIRFSTQYADDWTGDLKYLHRDYRPDLGRWPSRDPIGEAAGGNLYAFVRNSPVNATDSDGLAEFPRLPTVPSFPPIPTIPSFPWPNPLPPPTRPPTAPPSLPSLPQISLPSLCLFNPLRAGGVNFVGFSQAALNDFRVIPESGTTMGAPSTGWNSNVDGFWWRNSRQWFKIPDHCRCTITAAPTAGMPSAFTAECCCNACIHAGLTAYRDWRNDPRPTRPGFYPDTPPTNHGTDYPFENEQ